MSRVNHGPVFYSSNADSSNKVAVIIPLTFYQFAIIITTDQILHRQAFP